MLIDDIERVKMKAQTIYFQKQKEKKGVQNKRVFKVSIKKYNKRSFNPLTT